MPALSEPALTLPGDQSFLGVQRRLCHQRGGFAEVRLGGTRSRRQDKVFLAEQSGAEQLSFPSCSALESVVHEGHHLGEPLFRYWGILPA